MGHYEISRLSNWVSAVVCAVWLILIGRGDFELQLAMESALKSGFGSAWSPVALGVALFTVEVAYLLVCAAALALVLLGVKRLFGSSDDRWLRVPAYACFILILFGGGSVPPSAPAAARATARALVLITDLVFVALLLNDAYWTWRRSQEIEAAGRSNKRIEQTAKT